MLARRDPGLCGIGMVITPLEILRTHVGTICARCPHAHATDDGRLRCRKMDDLPIVPLIARGWPFCPLWHHTFGLPKRWRFFYAIRWYFSAAIKRLASSLGVCRPDEITIEARRQECAGCNKRDDTKCGACGCPITHKTALASERCPLEPPRWSSVASRWCRVLLWMESRGILISGPPPASFARFWSARPWGGTTPGCEACNDADKR